MLKIHSQDQIIRVIRAQDMIRIKYTSICLEINKKNKKNLKK